MFPLLHDESGVDVDDRTSDGLGRFNGQIEVLDFVVDTSGVEIDGCG